MTADPFGTAVLRRAVLDGWTAHPPRFREDANAEEDHARGHYRDRVVVELAQNAADAAARAGVPGRLLLRLAETAHGTTLTALNLGDPLDADGVASLASLRASAKRQAGTAGRFGVGFAAVRSVADEVTVTSGAPVHFSLAATREALADVPGALAEEVERRAASLPVLRLPFAGAAPTHPAVPPRGWDTAVVLTLRDAAAVDQVRAELRDVGDPLLLALPALTEIEVQVDERSRVLRDVADRWVTATRTGALDPALLAERPVEERVRTGWQVTWAVPRDAGPAARPPAPVVHAPTPTDEPCTLPALLIGTFPLDPARRHVAPGTVTDALLAAAASVFADLLLACRTAREAGEVAPDPLDLLPAGLPAGRLDAALHQAVRAAVRGAPVLPAADGERFLAADEAVVLDGPGAGDRALVHAAAAWVHGLVDLEPRHRHLTRVLGLHSTDLAEVVDGLPTDPARLTPLWDAAARAEGAVLEQLAALPVTLADGRTVRGARGLVIVDDVAPAVLAALSGWGVRVVRPDAVHPVLDRLGATRPGPWGLLEHPALRNRVLHGDPDAAAEVADVVLALVAAGLGSGTEAPQVGWWGEVLLEADDGDLLPAAGLVLPGSAAARWFDDEVLPPVAREVADRWGDGLAVIGVRTGLATVRVHPDDDGDDPDETAARLDGWGEYLDALRVTGGTAPAELAAVADLDAVRDDAWPEVLAALATGPARTALVDPVVLDSGARVASYTAWWLRRRSGLGLDRPFLLDEAGGPLSGLLDVRPAILDGVTDLPVLTALGGVRTAGDLGPEDWADVLAALPEVGARIDPALAAEVWRGLAALARADRLIADPDRLPALTADGVAVCDIEDVAVADPMWAQHPAVRPALVVPSGTVETLATELDLDLPEDRTPGRVTSTGRPRPVPPAARALVPDAPTTWVRHERLLVDGQPVAWWVTDGVPHATGDGVARALAHLTRWSDRDLLTRVVADPATLTAALLDRAGDERAPS